MRLEQYLEQFAAESIREALAIEAPAIVRPSKDPAHGDYQINGIMPLAKKLKKAPHELAQPVADKIEKHPAIEGVEVAGPGFINLHLRTQWIADQLARCLADGERDGVPEVDQPHRYVVDFSSPNLSKQLHVGHLRSTTIGDTIVRTLRFVGHHVIADNHLGDWGTLFGLLIVGMDRFGSSAALKRNALEEIERVYKLASATAKQEPEFADQARAELAKLHAGDPDNLSRWKQFVDASRVALERIYQRMNIEFDVWLGESAYQQMLPEVVDDLLRRGIAVEDDGAICVFFDDIPEIAKTKTPFIIRKKDGAFLYATTDIATVLYRRDHFKADRSIYITDQRQQLHFKQLFAVMQKLGVEMKLEHVWFGTVLGTDGKPLKTREGESVKLAALLDEAEYRAAERMREEGLNLDSTEIDALAPIVGIGAVKYADLHQNRLSDYQFDWEKLISFKGNAGPYLQYAHARIQAIFRKGGIEPKSLVQQVPIVLEEKEEIALAKQLIRFSDAVHQAAESRYPHLICDHLYSLARLFSSFYEECPVLKAKSEQRQSRLALASLVSRQLSRGLGLLGIQAPERM